MLAILLKPAIPRRRTHVAGLQLRLASAGRLLFLLLLALPSAIQALDFTYTTDTNAVTITGYTGPGGDVTIPNEIDGLPVTTIGDQAFYACTILTSVTLPDCVTTIGDGAFYYCISLDGINIPPRVTSIGSYAFCYCGTLTSINIPASVTSIGNLAFTYCTNLREVSVDTMNSVYSGTDGVLFNHNKDTLIYCPEAKTGNYTIPDTTINIGYAAFSFCTGLTHVTIPNSVTNIGMAAFEDCTGLLSLTIPNSVTSIGDSAFDSCSSLTSVTIGCGVTSIGNEAFFSAPLLTSVYFKGNAPTMGDHVFGYAPRNNFAVYYYNGKTGFTSPTWNGYQSVNSGYPPTIAAWLSTNGLSGNANLLDDPHHTGVSHLMAYALNLDPNRNPGGGLPRPVAAANQLGLTFYGGRDDVTYTVQVSSDLHTWTTAGVTVTPPDANQLRTATVPTTGGRRFLRLQVGY